MEKDIRDAVVKVENIGGELQTVSEAFWVLEDIFEREGYQRPERFDQIKAVKFAKRFPLYMSLYALLTNTVDKLSRQLLAWCEEMITGRKAQGQQDTE